MPQAIAAALTYKQKRILHVCGDSAFGFSGMELETIARYKLKVIIIIMNNNGIYSGLDQDSFELIESNLIPPNVLSPNAKYELMATAFGGHGYNANTVFELYHAMEKAIENKEFSLINCRIDPYSTKKPQKFEWLTLKESKI